MDIQATAVNPLKRACSVFLQDLQAIPEDAFDKSFGPKCRTVADLVYEVNLVNDDVARNMRGEPTIDWPEGWIKAPADFHGKAKVIQAFEESSKRALDTAESYTAEDLEGTVQTEHGETTRFERCRFMTLHLWYHSGQLNFIQTLLGDDEWHWA